MTKKVIDLPKKYEPAEFEKKWKQFWIDNSIYKWDSSKSRQDTFVVDTPPPTVSGSLHLGHVFSYTQTDIQVRYNRMMGKNIFYPMGWDDNGLPTERRVQNYFGIQCDVTKQYDESFKPKTNKSKKDPVEKISRKNFIETCDILTKEDEQVFKDLWQHLGLSIDWSLEYATIDQHCQKVSQVSFLDLVEKNQVYSTEAPTLWDVDFQTAVAQAECEDRERVGFYHDIKFHSEEDNNEFIVSTTRPELLAACIAVVAHPDDERYKHLFGKHAITPLFRARVPILASEHADPEKGSGILMVCTFGDSADIDWWKPSKLPLKQIVGRNGRILDIEYGTGPFTSTDPEKANKAFSQIQGLYVKQAQKKIVELLEDPNWGFDGTPHLVGVPEQTSRPVKFYEKGDRPLEFISTRQWFIKILEHKEAFLKQGEKINWHPKHMKSRLDHWIEGLNQDWCISRQRYFGVPFPVWYPVDKNGEPDYNKPIFADRSLLPIDPMVDCPKGFKENQRGKVGGFTGDPDVMDTWATSSVTPQIATHWGIDNQRHQKLFPMDLRPQGHDIIRTWAFYTIVKAFHHENEIPWKNIALSGWILDPDRKKMSKSKGNVITPEHFLSEFSADAVRYWASRARLGIDTAFDEGMFKIGRKLSNKIFNASKFVMMQIEGNENLDLMDLNLVTSPLDRIWIGKMLRLVENSTKSFNAYEYAGALQSTEDTFWNFCDHYLELVKGRTYTDEESKEKSSGLVSLNYSLNIFLRLFAPFFPYLAEEIWSWQYSKDETDSIHSANWPSIDLDENASSGFIEEKDTGFELAKELLSKIRAQKTQAQKKLKWPVSELEITISKEFADLLKGILPDIIRTGNVNDQGVTVKEEKKSSDGFCSISMKLE